MRERTPETQPPSYDNEQARQFYRTATNYQRLPKKYWPDKDVEVDLFDAAVIAQFESVISREYDESQLLTPEELAGEVDPVEARKRELAKKVFQKELERKDWAVEYVQGVSMQDISDAGHDNPQMQKEGAFNYVLRVAKVGAAEIKQLHIATKGAEETDPAKQMSTPETRPSLEILSKYVDLESHIKKLYEEQRIEAVAAQSLILLFELQKSTASPERQIRALHEIRTELERKIVSWLFDRQPNSDADRDIALEKGIAYTGKIIGRPGARVLGMRPYQLIRKVAEETGNSADQIRVRDHIYSHIAYAVDKLYPL